MPRTDAEKRRYWREYHYRNREKRLAQMKARDRLRRGPPKPKREKKPKPLKAPKPPKPPKLIVPPIRKRPATLAERIDSLLDAPIFDAAAIAHCSHRDRYADTALCLLHALPATGYHAFNPIRTLSEPHTEHLWPMRLATECGAVTYAEIAQYDGFGLDELRTLAEQIPTAKRALAALGELDWIDAPRDLRAIYALGKLVALRRVS